MSFLKCCVGADPRPSPESIRPVGGGANRRGNAAIGGSSLRPDNLGVNKKLKMPNEVFFDPSKPDGQLSSVTDPPTSARECTDHAGGKKRRDAAREARHAAAHKAEKSTDMEAPDNNGLTRGQNFMKVEKWLRAACMHKQVDIHPGTIITNLEDSPPQVQDTADPPTEKDRIPAILRPHQSPSTASRPR